jgi:hypothetical protein
MQNFNQPKMKEQKPIQNSVRKYLSELGRKGGSVKSEAKRLACIANGMKGVEARKKKQEGNK